MTSQPTERFRRDLFTWLAYFMLAYYAYLQAALGPLVPFLREELTLNYTVAGLHASAFALGMVLAGLLGDRLAHYVGRPIMFWGGGAGMALGVFVFITARTPALTIAAVLLMSLLGSFLLVTIQATLSDRHGERRAIALTESNIAASVAASLAPLLVGLTQQIGLGWRAALLIMVALWVLVFLRRRQQPLPAIQQQATASGQRRTPLPPLFWVYALVVLLGTCVEWSIIFWGADFLQHVVGLEKTLASSAMAVFLGAMVVGRITGSRLTRRFPAATLLPAAVVIALIGFPLFWLAPSIPLTIVGLFIAGLGVANLFPLTLSVAVGIAPEQSNTASARVSLSSGMGILIAPQILGAVADQVGIQTAFAVTGVLLVTAAVVIFAARFLAARQPAPAMNQISS